MIVAQDNTALAAFRAAHPRGSVFVPTMGALHEGHAELIRRAAAIARERGLAAGCSVSIFVNPTQFDDKKDFDRYPQTLAADLALCEAAGAACVYAPRVQDIYPPEAPIPVPALPRVATCPQLEDAFRPGHFAGVCQVVARLFDLVRPAVAVFGEKDWQQLQVIRAMCPSTPEIIGVETVREEDGLAMSSRNRFLSAAERKLGLRISRALFEGRKARTIEEGERIMRWTLARSGISPDYAVIREASSLEPRATYVKTETYRALITARVGSVRLLDNAPWSPLAE